MTSGPDDTLAMSLVHPLSRATGRVLLASLN
jgi:hypothetical protein